MLELLFQPALKGSYEELKQQLEPLIKELNDFYSNKYLILNQSCDRCGDCCVNNVISSFIEAFNLYSYLVEHYSNAHRLIVQPPRIGYSKHGRLVEKCNFLTKIDEKKTECIVYPARVFECRRYIKLANGCGHLKHPEVWDPFEIVHPFLEQINKSELIPKKFRGKVGYLRDLLIEIDISLR